MKRKLSKVIFLLLPLFLTACDFSLFSSSSKDSSSYSSSLIENQDETIYGRYLKQSHTINGFETVNQYVYSLMDVDEDSANIQQLDMYGLHKEQGSVIESEEGVDITIGLKVYKYIFDQEALTLTYNGKVNRRDVAIIYHKENYQVAQTTGEISFFDELFGDDLELNFYNYAPTIMMEGPDVMHIYYCSNKINKNVTDYIAYRRGELKGDGQWVFSEKSLLLEPTPGTWDERHTCDPSVIKGEFTYNEIEYNYLMAYLGCVSSDSSRNEVGIAVSKEPEGPWIKIDEINPIANYYTSTDYIGAEDIWTWGYGQPSLVSVDRKGDVLLFYTKGLKTATYQYVEYWDLSNLNNPIKKENETVSNAGVVNSTNGPDAINNADFVYDQFLNRLIVIKEDFPYQADEDPTWITSSNTIQYLSLAHDNDYLGETLFKTGVKTWQKIEMIGPSATGFARNHNMGLVSDEYGWLINPYQIPVVFTMSDLSSNYPDWDGKGQWPALHTYRLHGFLVEL